MKRLMPVFVFILLLLASCSKEESLNPSARTVKEAGSFLKPGMTTDELHDYLDTIPILVGENQFHWMLKDGSLWTIFENSDRGLVIVATKTRTNEVPNEPIPFSD